MNDAPEEWAGDVTDLDELAAFDAMRQFLHNWWERSGKPHHSVWEQGDVLWYFLPVIGALGRVLPIRPCGKTGSKLWLRCVVSVNCAPTEL